MMSVASPLNAEVPSCSRSGCLSAVSRTPTSLDEILSFIIVSSPAPSHPSADLIQRVIHSISLIDGVLCPHVIIVLDGYTVSHTDRTKKGKVTEALAANYSIYCELLVKYANDPDRNIFDFSEDNNFCPFFDVMQLSSHHGFAHAVRAGLERCTSSHAVIMQHDRAFCRRITCMSDLVCCMDRTGNEHIRYIGFPSSASRSHASLLKKQYGLQCLLSKDARIPVYSSEVQPSSDAAGGDSVGCQSSSCLQPLIFWYDSNHLCNVARYLEIFFPYKHTPAIMKERLGIPAIREMILRNGDFIEDKFGQFQRNYLISLPGRLASTVAENDIAGEIIQSFRWYGSYLYWEEDIGRDKVLMEDGLYVRVVEETGTESSTDNENETDKVSCSSSEVMVKSDVASDIPGAVVYVIHLRGRNYNPDYAAAQRSRCAKTTGTSDV